MNLNEDSSINLKFLLDKAPHLDMNLKDALGFNALHHLANNNLKAIATELVSKKT